MSETRTTLLAEKRDLERLDRRGRRAHIARPDRGRRPGGGDVSGLRAGRQSRPRNIGPGYVAFTRLWALTTEAYAMLIWERVVDVLEGPDI